MRMKLPKGTKLAIRQALEITHSASEINAILTRTLDKHLEIRGQSGGAQKRNQYAADELPGCGVCKEARA